jgi:hypothetical protein
MLQNEIKAKKPVSAIHIQSIPIIGLISIVCGILVLGFAILAQWLIYDDWLRENGPLRLVGAALSGLLASALVWKGMTNVRRRRIAMLARFETIARMNDRIRNALQVVSFQAYLRDAATTSEVREALDRIDSVLCEVIEDIRRHEEPGGHLPRKRFHSGTSSEDVGINAKAGA